MTGKTGVKLSVEWALFTGLQRTTCLIDLQRTACLIDHDSFSKDPISPTHTRRDLPESFEESRLGMRISLSMRLGGSSGAESIASINFQIQRYQIVVQI